MEATSALKLTQADPQATFPWAEAGSKKLLAVVRGDLDRWRVRLDVKRIAFVALNEEWGRDRRWQEFLRRIGAEEQVSAAEAVGALLLVVYELIRHHGAMGLQDEATQPLGNAVRTWGLPAGAEAALAYVADRAVATGLLRLVDCDDWGARGEYPSCAAQRATARRSAAQCATDKKRSDVDETGSEEKRSTGGPPVETSQPNSQGYTTTTDPPQGKATTNDDGPAMRRAVDWKRLVDFCHAERRKAGRSAWPASARDHSDLRAAAARAGTEEERRALQAALCDVLRWADNGGGIRVILRENGWL